MHLQCTSQTPQEQHASSPAPLPIEAEVLCATHLRPESTKPIAQNRALRPQDGEKAHPEEDALQAL
jgi:hypothetical protein